MSNIRHSRSFAKAFTWRITGTLDTFILSILVTKQIKFALAISGAELVTKIFLYYLHERIWERVKWGKKS